MESILRTIQKIIPPNLYKSFQPYYHFTLAEIGRIKYKDPSSKIIVIGVTGTKGKSSTAEMISKALESCGKKTAILSTIHFKIDKEDNPNLYKMTQPGRFFTQKFLRQAVDANCDIAIIELTSEGARFYRHHGIELNGLVFTNLSPEHIESHGSFERYKNAKLRLLTSLNKSSKRPRFSVSNVDDDHGRDFLSKVTEVKSPYSLLDTANLVCDETGSTFNYKGVKTKLHIPGKFNVYNALAAIKVIESLGLSVKDAIKGLSSIKSIRGRVEHISEGQDFKVIVDYAHTADSLTKLYETFPGKKIAVIGSTGGGRDKWKRPLLGNIADDYCEIVIVTDEDPYDDDAMEIINDVALGVKSKAALIIPDRRAAIYEAIRLAKKGDTILITGKGTDPYIMRENNTKESWDDAEIAREELKDFLHQSLSSN